MTKQSKKVGPLRVVVAGGGTAGHIEPALAVAEAVAARGAEVLALGTPKGLETSIVPDRGFELALIDPVPIPRKPQPGLAKVPFRLRRAVHQTKQILRDFDADVLIGFGGYVSAPAYLAARRLGIPFFVHEANARAGMANKLGVKLGGTGLNAVRDSGLPGEVVGIPLRAALVQRDAQVDRQRALAQWDLEEGRPTVLITGGSQGARSLNEAVAEGLDEVLEAGIQVLHSYGKKNEAPQARPGYVPVPYIEDMAAAYGVADIVVCRSGAMTVAENSAAGLPAIYVPLPHGNGEQALNAQDVVDAGGARLYADADFSGKLFAAEVTKIFSTPATLAAMQAATRAAGAGNAAETIALKLEEAGFQARA